MHRHAVVVVFVLSALSAAAQTSSSPQAGVPSDPIAISLAQKSVAALTGGAGIGDVSLTANVISVLGTDYETGAGTFSAKGLNESRVDLNLSGGTRSDVRNNLSGIPAGAWEKNRGTATPYAPQNCRSDAGWFFPALSSLSQTANPNLVFKYVGQEQHNGVGVQHIRVFRAQSPSATATDFYLDPNSFLPLAIGFNLHADNDANTNIPSEIRFANYQLVNGVEIPFHFQRVSNGSVELDITVTSAALNTGLLDTFFTLP